jgi:hypothetical protein
MEIKFVIDPNRLTMGDLITAEEADKTSARERRDMLAHHLVNEQGEYVDFDLACKLLNGLNMLQLKDAVDAFYNAITELNNKLIPPTSGGG